MGATDILGNLGEHLPAVPDRGFHVDGEAGVPECGRRRGLQVTVHQSQSEVTAGRLPGGPIGCGDALG